MKQEVLPPSEMSSVTEAVLGLQKNTYAIIM